MERMKESPRRRRLTRAFAWLDLAITLPLAIPFVGEWVITLLYRLDYAIGWFTGFPVLNPISMLFIHVTGLLGVVWALARLHDPSEFNARIDSLGRLAVSVLILFALYQGATPAIGLFLVTELSGVIVEKIWRPKNSNELAFSRYNGRIR
ncbi:hypothetical protein [Parvibaculum sp. MBR-TMA-1.3b-4.2]